MGENIAALQDSVLRSPNSRVLVTGACGFVGSKIVERLIANKIPVLATDVHPTSRFFYFNPLVEYVPADITSKDSIAALFKGREINFILHPAAVFKFSAPPEILNGVNVGGTENLLDVATGCSRQTVCVVFSTAMVYGENPSGIPISEGFTPRPPNPYAQSKLDAEKVALKFNGSDSRIIIVRPTAVYGRGSNYGLRKIIDIFASDFPLLPLPFGGDVMNSVVHVRDVAGAAIHLLSNWEGLNKNIFNIADSEPVRVGDAFNLIKEKLLSKTILLPLPGLPSEIFQKLLHMISSQTEIPLVHPFTGKLVTRLETDDFLALVATNSFSNDMLTILAGYELVYPSIATGIPATISHCVEFNELPPQVIKRLKKVT